MTSKYFCIIWPPSSGTRVSVHGDGDRASWTCAIAHVLHTCHILPFQQILWNRCFPSKSVKSAQNSPKSISEGGRIWRVCLARGTFDSRPTAPDYFAAPIRILPVSVKKTPPEQKTHGNITIHICICTYGIYIYIYVFISSVITITSLLLSLFQTHQLSFRQQATRFPCSRLSRRSAPRGLSRYIYIYIYIERER